MFKFMHNARHPHSDSPPLVVMLPDAQPIAAQLLLLDLLLSAAAVARARLCGKGIENR